MEAERVSEELLESIELVKYLEEIKELVAQVEPLVNEVLNRDFYNPDRHSNKYPEWDVKVHNSDESGKKGEHKISEEYDKLWEAYVEAREGFFWDCCEYGLGFVGEKGRRDFDWNSGIPEIEKCDYLLHQYGRSGGHIVLEEFDGGKTDLDIFEEIASCITEAKQLTAESDYDTALELRDELQCVNQTWLKNLLIFCESLDKFDASAEWNYECNYRRSEQEDLWEEGDFSSFGLDRLKEMLDDEDISEKIKTGMRKHIKSELGL